MARIVTDPTPTKTYTPSDQVVFNDQNAELNKLYVAVNELDLGAALIGGEATQDFLAGIMSVVSLIVDGRELKAPATGEIKYTLNNTLESGWLYMNGQTIGSAASGATARANADTQDLFVMLWDNTVADRSVIEIFDSLGAPSTFGVDAISDFTANKRLTLPDSRSIVLIGKDDMGGVSRNLIPGIWAKTYMGTGGDHEHTLTVDELPAHSHVVTVDSDGSHSHTVNSHSHGGGSHNHTAGMGTGTGTARFARAASPTASQLTVNLSGTIINSNSPGTNSAGSHSHTGIASNTGLDSAHNIVQPSMATNVWIKL